MRTHSRIVAGLLAGFVGASCFAAELLDDGDLQQDASAWTLSGSTSFSTERDANGSNGGALRFSRTGMSLSDPEWVGSQCVNLSAPTARHRLAASVLTDGLAVGTFGGRVYVDLHTDADCAGPVARRFERKFNLTTSNVWYRALQSLTPGAGMASARVRLFARAYTHGNGLLYFDRISFGPMISEGPALTALHEHFDDPDLGVANVQGLQLIEQLRFRGFISHNQSEPPGAISSWVATNPNSASAFDGHPNSAAAVNYNAVRDSGTASSWLITPLLQWGSSSCFSFYSRAVAGSTYPDRLEVRISNQLDTGLSTGADDVGHFGTPLLVINPNLLVGGYPSEWTRYQVCGLPASGVGRIAFRYHAGNCGAQGANCNFLAIDALDYPATAAND